MSKKWYIVTVISGSEQKIAESVLQELLDKDIESVSQVIVPVQKSVVVKKGKPVVVEKKILPGYLMVEMEYSSNAVDIILNYPRVIGFLGGDGRPQPVSDAEINRIFEAMEEDVYEKDAVIDFVIGSKVSIVDGPFESFVGTVEDIDYEKSRLKISVSIFGRSTPVDLEFTQVKKIEE